MPDTDCPKCGQRGMLATNYSPDWYKCQSCKERYEVEHTTCSVSGCGTWAAIEGYCHHHAAQKGIRPEGEPYRADHATDHEPPPTCSQPGCIAVSDHDGRCSEHPLPYDPPDPPEERELPMCAHRGCLNEPDTDGLCWSHYERREHPDRKPDPFRDGRD